MARRTRFDKQHEFDTESRHMVLLCKNETGYRNLSYMVSQAYIEGFYIRPRIDLDLLRAHSEGLIGLSACLAGEIPAASSTAITTGPRPTRWRCGTFWGGQLLSGAAG